MVEALVCRREVGSVSDCAIKDGDLVSFSAKEPELNDPPLGMLGIVRHIDLSRASPDGWAFVAWAEGFRDRRLWPAGSGCFPFEDLTLVQSAAEE